MLQKKILINKRIVGVLSYPEDIASLDAPLPAVLFLHGFATNKDEVNDIYKKMSLKLETDTIVNLRIDFYGYGESLGTPEGSTIATMVSDAVHAFKYICQLPYVNSGSVGIIGFSLGAAIAMLATEHVRCKSLVLLSPALDLVKDFTSFLGKSVMEKLANCSEFIDVELPWRTIKISKDFYSSLEKHNPLSAIESYSDDLICFAGENDFSALNAESINKSCLSKNLIKKIFPDADHIFTLTSGESILCDVSLEACSCISTSLKKTINPSSNIFCMK